MPEVNGAVDRRTLSYWQNGFGDEHVHCYMCFVCKERHLHVKTFRVDKYRQYTGTIEYVQWSHIINSMACVHIEMPVADRQEEFDAKWNASFDYEKFVDRYMTRWKDRKTAAGLIEHGFIYDSPEWMRRVHLMNYVTETREIRKACCCPEDVITSDICKKHKDDPSIICEYCRVPVCLECYSRLSGIASKNNSRSQLPL